jgi:hypothetical protein
MKCMLILFFAPEIIILYLLCNVIALNRKLQTHQLIATAFDVHVKPMLN